MPVKTCRICPAPPTKPERRRSEGIFQTAAFLADYAQSVNAANTDLDGTAALCEEQGVVAKAAIAKKALPNCNIVCLTGEELKADVSGYLQVLYDADPAAVGGTLPGEDFYWTAQ